MASWAIKTTFWDSRVNHFASPQFLSNDFAAISSLLAWCEIIHFQLFQNQLYWRTYADYASSFMAILIKQNIVVKLEEFFY